MTVSDSEILSAGILIVDDQEANLLVLEQMLARSGYSNITTTSKPRDVRRLYQAHRYDLILLDLQMPGMDGFQVMEVLKEIEQGGYLPVLVVTAQPSQKLPALQAGAKDFISKPFDVLEIQTRIRNMLEVRLLYKRIEANNRQLEQTVLERTAELRDSEARFRSLVELATDWYWEQDEHGHFTRVSGPALEMLGLGDATANDVEGQPRWNESDRALLGEKLAARQPFLDFVYRRVHADGSEQFLQTSGEPRFDEAGRFRGYRGIGMDVTGRMGGGLEGVLILDRTSMRYTDADGAACRISGYAREQLLELGPSALFEGATGMHASEFDALVAGNLDRGVRRLQLVHKDGRRIPVETRQHATRIGERWLRIDLVREL